MAGKFLEELCPGLLGGVGCGQARKNMFCSWGLPSENIRVPDLETQ